MCARGCFDKQKDVTDHHSSTASRLSQRMVLSCAGNIAFCLHGDDIDRTFWISVAHSCKVWSTKSCKSWVNNLLRKRQTRSVCILPPENVWGHFRKMSEAPDSLKIPDHERGSEALQRRTADVPTCAASAHWVECINNRWEVALLLTAC